MEKAVGIQGFVCRFVAVFLSGLLCLATGCMSPRRTFVSESAQPLRSTAQNATSTEKTNAPHRPAKEEPSVWSKWMDSLTPESFKKEPAKPAVRIPLPRTDVETVESESAPEPALEGLPF